MERYTRIFTFSFKVLGMALENKTLLKPIWFNLAITVPISILLSIVTGFASSPLISYVLMASGLTLLYFCDYFANGLTSSLIYEQVTGGRAEMSTAVDRTKKAAGGIFMFAAVSGLFDLLQSYASERDDIIGKIISRIVYSVWTAAVYVVMPAMVIEGIGFGEAFSKSKEMAKNDPTGVGSGIIGIALANWILGSICMGVAYTGSGVLARIHPIVGALFFYTFFNLYWCISGYIKITYFTCFYLWATECAKRGSTDAKHAPKPLAEALGAYAA